MQGSPHRNRQSRHAVDLEREIGKRKGAWGLKDGVPENQKGFLLNHLIHELLAPARRRHAVVEFGPG